MTSSEVIKLSANSFAILVIVLLGLILIPVPEDLPTKIVAAVLLALGLALNCFLGADKPTPMSTTALMRRVERIERSTSSLISDGDRCLIGFVREGEGCQFPHLSKDIRRMRAHRFRPFQQGAIGCRSACTRILRAHYHPAPLDRV